LHPADIAEEAVRAEPGSDIDVEQSVSVVVRKCDGVVETGRPSQATRFRNIDEKRLRAGGGGLQKRCARGDQDGGEAEVQHGERCSRYNLRREPMFHGDQSLAVVCVLVVLLYRSIYKITVYIC